MSQKSPADAVSTVSETEEAIVKYAEDYASGLHDSLDKVLLRLKRLDPESLEKIKTQCKAIAEADEEHVRDLKRTIHHVEGLIRLLQTLRPSEVPRGIPGKAGSKNADASGVHKPEYELLRNLIEKVLSDLDAGQRDPDEPSDVERTSTESFERARKMVRKPSYNRPQRRTSNVIRNLIEQAELVTAAEGQEKAAMLLDANDADSEQSKSRWNQAGKWVARGLIKLFNLLTLPMCQTRNSNGNPLIGRGLPLHHRTHSGPEAFPTDPKGEEGSA